MASESFMNNAITQIAQAGGIGSADTTITVVNGAVFYRPPNFRLICDSEIMICTGVSSNVLTVTRGAENTTAAAHANGADIYNALTEGGLIALINQASFPSTISPVVNVSGFKGADGAAGANGAAGTMAVGSVSTLAAGASATVQNVGTANAAVLNFGIPQGAQGAQGISGAGAFPVINVPSVSALTKIGTDAYVLTQDTDGISIDGANGTTFSNTTAWVQALTKSANKFTCTLVAHLATMQTDQQCALVLYDVPSNSWAYRAHLFLTPTRSANNTWQIGYRAASSGTSTNATLTYRPNETLWLHDRVWLRIYSDGTNRYYQWSADGVHWITLYSEAWNYQFVPGAWGFASYGAGLNVPPIWTVEQLYTSAP